VIPAWILTPVMLVSLVLGVLVGVMLSGQKVAEIQEQAVKQGHAEWRVADQATGRTEFAWKGGQP
jgi:hypothetical protein